MIKNMRQISPPSVPSTKYFSLHTPSNSQNDDGHHTNPHYLSHQVMITSNQLLDVAITLILPIFN